LKEGFYKVIRYKKKDGTEFIIEKLVRQVCTFLDKKNITFVSLVVVIDAFPHLLTRSNKSKVITVRPDPKLGLLLHAGIFHKQEFIDFHFAEDITLFYEGIEVNHGGN